MILKKLKKYKILFEKLKQNRGFVILYAVTLAAIILSITMGISQVAYEETLFSTSAKDTNDAFFAADTGLECALYYDRFVTTDPTINAFTTPPGTNMRCGGSHVVLSGSSPSWTFTVTGLGSTSEGCAKVIVTKTPDVNNILRTKVVSLGYNNGGSSCVASTNTIQRELDSNY